MKDKNELLQIRVDSDLKSSFYELAEKRGVSLSNLLRSLMINEIENEDSRLTEVEWRCRAHNMILLEILSMLHRQAMMSPNNQSWEIYKKTFIPEYLDECISDTLKDGKVPQDIYWQRYWAEVDKRWFSNFSSDPPIFATHLNRDFMDENRKAHLDSKRKKTK